MSRINTQRKTIQELTSYLAEIKAKYDQVVKSYQDKIKDIETDLIKEIRETQSQVYTIRASGDRTRYNTGIYDIAYFSTVEKAVENLILKKYTTRRGTVTHYSIGICPITEIENYQLLTIDDPLPAKYLNRAKKQASREKSK